MKKLLIGYVFGVVMVFFALWAVGVLGKLDQYNTAISQCEAELPRNQTCEITARVKENDQ